MESGDSSDEEAPPSNPNRKEPMRQEWLKAVSMLVARKTKDSQRRGAFMVVTKKSWHGMLHSLLFMGESKKACMSWV